MISKEKLARINHLAKKSREVGLSVEEAKEQTQLRNEYLTTFRSSMLTTLKGVTILDPKGKDVTPKKLKAIKEKKSFH